MFLYFFSIIAIMYIPLTVYVGLRLWQVGKYFFPGFNKITYGIIFIILSYLFILNFFSRGLGKGISEALTTISYYWIIALFYLCFIFLTLDFLRIICKFTNTTLPFKTIIPRIGIIAILFVAILLIYGTWNARHPKVTHYDLVIPKAAGSLNELRVALVSDIHLSNVMNNNRLEQMVKIINSLNPDLVLIPGDIIEDADVFAKQNMMDNFKKLQAGYGIFISLGNHEYYRGNVKETLESLEKIGFHILKDEYVLVENSFYVVGQDDPAVGHLGVRRKELKEILEGVDKKLPLFLLNHQPIDLEIAQKEGIDLQVSGHTHRGQVFPANIITSLIFEKDWGYLKKGNLQLVVTSGYGLWGPPLRIGSSSEIVEIIINFKVK